GTCRGGVCCRTVGFGVCGGSFVATGFRGGGGIAVVDGDALQPSTGLFEQPGGNRGESATALFAFGFFGIPLVVCCGEPGDGVVDPAAVLRGFVDRFQLVGDFAGLWFRRFPGGLWCPGTSLPHGGLVPGRLLPRWLLRSVAPLRSVGFLRSV